ncbi:MAG TPA: L-seryl-tRNA(Sec) selenium transferase, partial [Anaerolineales bacterium]|nr:L-seryl-tRNA(Sec) selenium transferase [Anaerolineales bacterium]
MTPDPEAANPLRRLPSVDAALQWSQVAALTERFGRSLTVEAVRAALEQARRAFSPENPIPDAQEISAQIAALLESWTEISLRPVINATGVIIHTNLGRAPLSQAALQAAARAADSYSTLEYDLASGKRGSRLVHAEALLQRLTGAQAALVVNNNAAAVLLVLTALARRR